MNIFKIHPAIGIARMGNSDDFYLTPEQPGVLPIECNAEGQERTNKDGSLKRVKHFKDSTDSSKILRQGARFKVFVYKDDKDKGSEVKVGASYDLVLSTATTGRQTVQGTVTDIEWTVHLANKKASWYEFQETAGMHGYKPFHPLRNPKVVQPDKRRQLIIDPGPVSVSLAKNSASIAKGSNPGYPQSFPPHDIKPHKIKKLGDLLVNKQDDSIRLVVLGGEGKSGSTKTPVITSFVNNDGWFDDTSDGPVTAKIHYEYDFKYTDSQGKPVCEIRKETVEVNVPAWVVVGYPRYVPEILDMVTMDETLYDLAVRNFAFQPSLYGEAPFEQDASKPDGDVAWAKWRNAAQYNLNYYPKYYAEIWPILSRPDQYKYVLDFDPFEGGDPHNTGTGGNLDKNALSQPPKNCLDPHAQQRQFIYGILRQPGQENQYQTNVTSSYSSNSAPIGMPLQCGNNPLSNTSPDKFFRLTDTQLFLLSQWSKGLFVNECQEWGEQQKTCKNPWAQPPTTGEGIDRGVLSNVLGGSFCPGAEMTWIMLNPAIYSEAYRINPANYQAGALSLPKVIADIDGSPAENIAAGMEPGDLTKYIGIPWQADFHECTNQDINITYENWNNLYLDSTGDPVAETMAYNIPWWPAHRPVVVNACGLGQVYWASGIAENKSGDLQMVQSWKDLGFIKLTTCKGSKSPSYVQVERNDDALGSPVSPGELILGQTMKKSEHND